MPTSPIALGEFIFFFANKYLFALTPLSEEIVLFVNDVNYIHFSYERYIENKLREAFELEGTPIKIILRKKEI